MLSIHINKIKILENLNDIFTASFFYINYFIIRSKFNLLYGNEALENYTKIHNSKLSSYIHTFLDPIALYYLFSAFPEK